MFIQSCRTPRCSSSSACLRTCCRHAVGRTKTVCPQFVSVRCQRTYMHTVGARGSLTAAGELLTSNCNIFQQKQCIALGQPAAWLHLLQQHIITFAKPAAANTSCATRYRTLHHGSHQESRPASPSCQAAESGCSQAETHAATQPATHVFWLWRRARTQSHSPPRCTSRWFRRVTDATYELWEWH